MSPPPQRGGTFTTGCILLCEMCHLNDHFEIAFHSEVKYECASVNTFNTGRKKKNQKLN